MWVWREGRGCGLEGGGTFDELAAVGLAGCDFEGYDVVLAGGCQLVFVILQICDWGVSYLGFVQELYGYAYRARHGGGGVSNRALPKEGRGASFVFMMRRRHNSKLEFVV